MSTPHAWQSLAEIIDHVIDLSTDERKQWLDANCTDDELRVKVEGLLNRESEEGHLDRFRDDLSRARDFPFGGRIGDYALVGLLGRGGMATVYLAEREFSGFTQRVALKLMRVGLFEPVQKQLFLREQQILVKLEHPGIVRLIDAGFASSDVPFLVMEYADGLPIDQYCVDNHLGLRERLNLFARVCDVVSYAHRHMVIHRDLKPSNILVTNDGELKLLDFGIAKLIQDEHDVTRTAQQFLTPAYAAPEQFEGAAVSTTTDVFALGAIFHLLLTGVGPEFRDGDLRLPSSRFSTSQAKDASKLPGPAREVRRLLQGDLDSILCRALAHAPAERYPDASELRSDIQRYLLGRPVIARRGGVGYRLAKLAWRHRYATIAIATVIISLTVAAGVSRFQSIKAHEAADMAAIAALRAENEATRTAIASEFLATLLRISYADNPDTSSSGDLLQRAVTKVWLSMEGAPRQKADATEVLVRVYRDWREPKRGGIL